MMGLLFVGGYSVADILTAYPILNYGMVIGMFGWGLVAAWVLAHMIVKGILGIGSMWKGLCDRYIVGRRRSKEKKEKGSNLLLEYVKAKKDKVCPIIEFEKD